MSLLHLLLLINLQEFFPVVESSYNHPTTSLSSILTT